MEYIRFGNTGLQVSRIILGCMTYGDPKWREWILDEAQGIPFIHRALDLGINFFDTADMYSLGESERVLGKALQAVPRNEVVIASKLYWPMSSKPNQRGLSRKHIMESINASLNRLGTDYVDLYQIHRWDSETPLEETLEALNDVVRSGKALYIGASSMWAWQFAKALYTSDRYGWARFVSMQNHYNLIYREEEREMIPLCRAEGVAVIPWSPLARGFLAGTRAADRRGESKRSHMDKIADELYTNPEDFDILDRVVAIASQHNVKPAQVALAWMLHKPGISAPIIGASKMSHLDDAVGAVDVRLTDDEIAALEAPYTPRPIAGHE
jgi:1-deoxyxylulose-5-phosphate synthase